MIHPSFPLALAAVGWITASSSSARAQIPFAIADLSGRQLVERLCSDDDPTVALYELRRRNGRADWEDWHDLTTFRAIHPHIDVVVAQQTTDRPIAIALSERVGYGGDRDDEVERYAVHDELLDHYDPTQFPAEIWDTLALVSPTTTTTETSGRPTRFETRLVHGFDADGREIKPFGSNNLVSDEYLTDLNHDGEPTRLGVTSYGVRGVRHADVLKLTPVTDPPSPPTLSILLNWQRDEWGYQISDDDGDGDGVFEIELGPRREGETIEPRVHYVWSTATQRYEGPAGGDGDHFRRLDGSNVFKQLAQLRDDGCEFPVDPMTSSVAVSLPHVATPTASARIAAAMSSPYVHRSMRDASDAELRRFMGEGRTVFDLQRPLDRLRIPRGFWSRAPRDAAMALWMENHPERHRRQWRVEIPNTTTVDVDEIVDGATVEVSIPGRGSWGERFVLSITSSGATLVQSPPGAAPGSKKRDEELRIDSVDAKQAIRVLLWLKELRSTKIYLGGSFGFSTGDRAATFRLRGADFDWQIAGKAWTSSVLDRSTGGDHDEAVLNIARHLIGDHLVQRSGGTVRPLPRRSRDPIDANVVTAPPATGRSAAELAEILDSGASLARQLDALQEWAHLAIDDPEARRLLSIWLRAQLLTTQLPIEPLLWAAWTADLQELTDAIVKIATSSPDDAEGPHARRRYGAQKPVPIVARYHFARQIAAIWLETDADTRRRLLQSFAEGRELDVDADAPRSLRWRLWNSAR